MARKISSVFVIGAIIIAFIAFSLSRCNFLTHWSESKKAEFCKKCEEETDTLHSAWISFRGFSDVQMDSVLVINKRRGKMVDRFYIYPSSDNDKVRPRDFSTRIEKAMLLKDTILFEVSGEKPFVLCDMKMVMYPQFTMYSENYGCVLGTYSINGKVYKSQGIELVKEGFHYSWER
jgi:hypothetical protein